MQPTTARTRSITTFGAAMNAADDFDIQDGLDAAAVVADETSSLLPLEEIWNAIDRDSALATSSGRWRLNEDDKLVHGHPELIPGDVVAMRSSAAGFLLEAAVPSDKDLDGDGKPDASALERMRRATRLIQLLYAATPYWLDQPVAWAAMASQPLSDEDRSELRLAGPALVLFSSGMEISAEYMRIDPDLPSRMTRPPDDDTVGEVDPEQYPPLSVRGGTIDVLRWWQRVSDRDEEPLSVLLRHQLIGVLLCADESGGLAQPVAWLLRLINPPVGATTETIVTGNMIASKTSSSFTLVEGALDQSTLRPIAEALAAYVSWGDWKAPDPTDPLPDTSTREFRKRAKSSAFKRAERRGQFSDVHVLAAHHATAAVSHRSESEGPTVRTHYRRGHWKRVRVGPRDNWSYQRRRIAPVIVNAGQDPVADLVRVYRLPPLAD